MKRQNLVLKRKLNNPLIGLGVAVIFSLLIYWFVFVRMANLLDLYQQPLISLVTISSNIPSARWVLVAAFVALGGLNWLGWHSAMKAQGKAAWSIVVGGFILFAIILLFLYPFDAADIFDNIVHGRIISIYNANPFIKVGSDFKTDLFYPYMGWKFTPSEYGPVWELMAAFTTYIAGNGFIANVFAFKLLNGIFLAGSAVCLFFILRQYMPERTLSNVLLFIWNPIVLYETIGNGHNDIVIVFFIMAAALAMLHKKYVPAVLALVIGTLVKFVPALLLPLVVVIAWRELPSLRSRLRFLFTAGFISFILILLAYGPFWQGIQILGIARRQTLFTTSIASMVYYLLRTSLGAVPTGALLTKITGGVTLIFVLWQCYKAWHDHSWMSFHKAAFNILMFYMFVTIMWFHNWYTVWPLGLALILPVEMSMQALFVCFACLSKPLLIEPLLLWKTPFEQEPWLEIKLSIGVLSLPWLYFLIMWGRQLRERSMQRVKRDFALLHRLPGKET
ncbi:MAG TPA: hypothetical protein VKF38_10245 [Anaerolineaceae bacterium]|nr:hypothetical protein [Anaerolineaceae bacterium]